MAGRNSLACAVCQRIEDEPVVCHHCGRPLCVRCRHTWRDTAFGGSRSLPRAYHCSNCLQRYHMSLPDILQVVSNRIGLGTRSANQRLRRARRQP